VGYVEDLLKLTKLPSNVIINAYVIGDSISNNVTLQQKLGDYINANIFITTYSQLIDSADRRLFNLRSQIKAHCLPYSDKIAPTIVETDTLF
jgi:hypothetical protein